MCESVPCAAGGDPAEHTQDNNQMPSRGQAVLIIHSQLFPIHMQRFFSLFARKYTSVPYSVRS